MCLVDVVFDGRVVLRGKYDGGAIEVDGLVMVVDFQSV